MSSAETPDDMPPSDEEVSLGSFTFWTCCLVVLALAVIGYGEATGSFNFFR